MSLKIFRKEKSKIMYIIIKYINNHKMLKIQSLLTKSSCNKKRLEYKKKVNTNLTIN